MRVLADVDALIARLREVAGCSTCDSYDGIRCRVCSWDDAIAEVEGWADSHSMDLGPEIVKG